ncbi:MAG: MerR family transcriptional regulator [Fimbriimonadales bacterium]
MKHIEMLKQYREHGRFTIEELVAVANSLLEQWAPVQPRYKVVPFPDVRTVRFYTAHRLLDPPSQRRGNRVLYDYHHLVQLVALKTLQAQYIPLRAVRRMIEGKSVEELENLLSTVLDKPSDVELAQKMGDAAKSLVEEASQAAVYAATRTSDKPYPEPQETHQFYLTSWAVLTVDPTAAKQVGVTEINRLSDLVRLSLMKAYHEDEESKKEVTSSTKSKKG